MHIGAVFCSSLMRSMEYDADHYEIEVSGSESFEQTTMKLYVWNAALQHAYQQMVESKRAAQDLSTYLNELVASLSEEDRLGMEAGVFNGKTHWLDSHPHSRDRIAKARKARAPGQFQHEFPARDLFANFEVVSGQVTALHYAEDWGIEVHSGEAGSEN